MYNVYDASDVFYIYDMRKEEKSLIGNKKDFIKFLASGYKGGYYVCQDIWIPDEKYVFNTYFEIFACSQGDVNEFTRWQFFDGMDRCINPKIYEKEAYSMYLNNCKNVVKYNKKKWCKKQVYKGTFRREPVQGIHKPRMWKSFWRHPHYKRLISDFYIPEWEEYKKGNFISSWDYEEIPRCREKNWKSQGKRRHQWQ